MNKFPTVTKIREKKTIVPNKATLKARPTRKSCKARIN